MDATRGFLRQVIDINPHFIFVKDRQGRFTLVNDSLAEAYGNECGLDVGRDAAERSPNASTPIRSPGRRPRPAPDRPAR